MCGWSKRMLLPFVICVSFCVNSVVAISRRPPLRVYRKLNSISSSSSSSLLPLPPRLAFMPPRVAAAQNFHPEYELPPFMMSKPSISTSYDVPMIPSSDYGPPRPSTEYGLPQPPSDYGASRPSTDYGPPRPSSDYGMSFPSSDYGAPMLSTKYGPPKNVKMKPIVHKHIYVHIPPPEPEAYTSRAPITIAPPQKHYKIVFIKAPTQPAPTVPEIPLQPLDEEKTLVYVLVKKPEDPPNIVIPTPASTPPSKPEVYFIRYKAQDESDGPYPPSHVNINSVTLGPPLASYGPPISRSIKSNKRSSVGKSSL